jgi:hypothetical protein
MLIVVGFFEFLQVPGRLSLLKRVLPHVVLVHHVNLLPAVLKVPFFQLQSLYLLAQLLLCLLDQVLVCPFSYLLLLKVTHDLRYFLTALLLNCLLVLLENPCHLFRTLLKVLY